MYFVIEHDIRPDGVVNTTETSRSDFGLALAFFHERASKLPTNANFVSGHLILVSEELEVVKEEHIAGAYQAPEVSEEGAEE